MWLVSYDLPPLKERDSLIYVINLITIGRTLCDIIDKVFRKYVKFSILAAYVSFFVLIDILEILFSYYKYDLISSLIDNYIQLHF